MGGSPVGNRVAAQAPLVVPVIEVMGRAGAHL